MANGDDAAAAGMDVLNPSTALVKNGADEINKTRDYISQRTSAVQPIAKGGTGATTAAAARTALGIIASNIPSTGAGVQADLNFLASSKSPVGHTHAGLYSGAALFEYQASGNQFYTATKVGINNELTVVGPIYSPHGRANPVSSSWVAAALDSAGRLGVQPSARRFKKNVRTYEYTDEQLDAFLALLDRVYQLRAFIEGAPTSPDLLGWIAEEVLEAGFGELVAFDDDEQPLTINYAMAVIPLHALAKRQARQITALAARLDAAGIA